MSDDEPTIETGPCCGCGSTDKRARNMLMLSRRGPSPGKGWGCVVCGLPSDGAVAVMCDSCVTAEVDPQFVCVGWISEGGRMPIAELPNEPFDHDMAKHREDDFGDDPFEDDDE